MSSSFCCENAIEAATNAGLEPGAHFRDAVLDYALTEDPSYIQSASTAVDATDVTTDAKPAETALSAPELSVDAQRVINQSQPLTLTVEASHPDPAGARVVISNGTGIMFEEDVSGAFESQQTVS